jgi:hypothetical protein
MPRGAGRERVALEQHHVGTPEMSEVIGDAAADDPTTDDDDSGTVRELSGTHGYWMIAMSASGSVAPAVRELLDAHAGDRTGDDQLLDLRSHLRRS